VPFAFRARLCWYPAAMAAQLVSVPSWTGVE